MSNPETIALAHLRGLHPLPTAKKSGKRKTSKKKV
jgi:hypothetical protein